MYPTIYNTIYFRKTGKEYNTQVKSLESIGFLYVWAQNNSIDLEKSFLKCVFLSTEQIRSLCDHVEMNFLDYKKQFEKPRRSISLVENIKEYRKHSPQRKTVKIRRNKGETTAIKLTYIKKYLKWLSNLGISSLPEGSPNYQQSTESQSQMLEAIEAAIPGAEEPTIRKGLKQEERRRFLEVITPTHPENPFKSMFVKVRNELIGHLLINLGVRRAELLLLKISDIRWNPGGIATIDIRDHPNDPTDTRKKKPQFKTLERQLPLEAPLVRKMRNYINLRKKIPRALNHDYLIVSVGGKPLSLGLLDTIFSELRRIKGLPNNLSPHLLRYTWNDLFSEMWARQVASEKYPEREAMNREKQLRRYMQGWSENSKMPQKYARHYIETEANKVGLEMQKDLFNISTPLTEEDDIPF